MVSQERTMIMRSALVLLLLCILASFACAGKVTRYLREKNVPVYTVKIGPFSNPSVAFHYKTFPLCKPEEAQIKRQRQGLADKLDGTHREPSQYAIKFKSTYHSIGYLFLMLTLQTEVDRPHKFRIDSKLL